MIAEPEIFNSLPADLGKEELIRQAAEQLIKDFSQFGKSVSFSGNAYTAYTELYAQLIPVINNMLIADKERLKAMLYRIDVSEQAIKKAMGMNKLTMTELLTTLILERELKKVLTRTFFSQKKNK